VQHLPGIALRRARTVTVLAVAGCSWPWASPRPPRPTRARSTWWRWGIPMRPAWGPGPSPATAAPTPIRHRPVRAGFPKSKPPSPRPCPPISPSCSKTSLPRRPRRNSWSPAIRCLSRRRRLSRRAAFSAGTRCWQRDRHRAQRGSGGAIEGCGRDVRGRGLDLRGPRALHYRTVAGRGGGPRSAGQTDGYLAAVTTQVGTPQDVLAWMAERDGSTRRRARRRRLPLPADLRVCGGRSRRRRRPAGDGFEPLMDRRRAAGRAGHARIPDAAPPEGPRQRRVAGVRPAAGSKPHRSRETSG